MVHNPQTSLTKEQKQAIGLLSIGTFLEYFDLMLYVHMAVLLNELFFPPSDAFTTSLLSSFALCSTFVFRPIGALIFGYIGDNVGRKTTVVITTTLMAISCVIMANLPTYDKIGVTASWLLTICRIVQGISSMGEVIGAEIYVTEITKPPIRYPAVSLIGTFTSVGAFCALGMASLVMSYGMEWRVAFWFGSIIAVVGILARTTLRETAEFADAKRCLKKNFKDFSIDESVLENNRILQEKVSTKTSFTYFLMQCAAPVTFYFSYIHCASVLRNSFGYNAQDVIYHNFIVVTISLLNDIVQTYLSYKIYPLFILKFRSWIFMFTMLVIPYFLSNVTSPMQLLLFQTFFIIFKPCTYPAVGIFIKHFPIFKRFTYSSWLYALARAFMYIITSFGFVYLVKYFDQYGILFIIVPVAIGFAYGTLHFIKLEKVSGNYPLKI